MDKYYRAPCGCQFKICGDSPNAGEIPALELDISKVPLDCPHTWKLISDGMTKGVFQLESQLGKQWSKKLKPENIEHLAALGALLRPGCLRAKDENNISMTEHYCLRKNNEEPVEYFHPSLQDILQATYGVLTYQEQSTRIAQKIAGFNLQEADILRKAIGKKKAEMMSEVEEMFISGAERSGVVTKEEAASIFGQIRKSERYSFNKSHSVCYAILGYWSAYCKTHFPVVFFTSWLFYSKEKQKPRDEIKELVNDAKLFGVEVLPPDITNMEANFSTDGLVVTFGLSDIKGVGESQITKLVGCIKDTELELSKPIKDWTWYEFVTGLCPRLSPTLVKQLIHAGALRKFKLPRKLMEAEADLFFELTDKEVEWAVKNRANYTTFIDLAQSLARIRKEGGGVATKKRLEKVVGMVDMVKNPPTPLEDTAHEIAWREEELLGVSLTFSKVDGCDTTRANTTCKEFLQGKNGYMMFGVQVESIREHTIKKGKNKGKNMAFLSISDSSCVLEDVVVFSDVLQEFGHLLQQNNTVMIHGERDAKKGSLIVKGVWQI